MCGFSFAHHCEKNDTKCVILDRNFDFLSSYVLLGGLSRKGELVKGVQTYSSLWGSLSLIMIILQACAFTGQETGQANAAYANPMEGLSRCHSHRF